MSKSRRACPGETPPARSTRAWRLRTPKENRSYCPDGCAAFTVTFTCAFVQQHWKPPPPSPVASFPCARRTYSPGSLNVTLVDALPPALRSIVGRAASIFTAAGPRKRLHATTSGGCGGPPSGFAAPRPRPRPRPGSGMFRFGPSSLAHTVSGSGTPTVAFSVCASPIGGPAKPKPSAANFSVGGVLPLAGSSKGDRIQSAFVCIVIVLVWPLETRGQLNFFAPKSLGTLVVN